MLAPQPTSNYDDYLEEVRIAILQNPEDWTFKSTAGYRHILEHVSGAQGEQFLDVIAEDWPIDDILKEIRPIIRENDRYGLPLKTAFPRVGFECSPSNLRYAWHALVLWRYIESLGIPTVNVIEIGGGYGGLALFVRRLSHLFKTEIRSYGIADIRSVSLLTNLYLYELNAYAQAIDGLDAQSIQKLLRTTARYPRVFVSCYGFAEFDESTQLWYQERIIKHCDHGFLVWNYAGNWPHRPANPVYAFTDKPLTIVPERPLIDRDDSFVFF